jgi:hypothetical protein
LLGVEVAVAKSGFQSGGDAGTAGRRGLSAVNLALPANGIRRILDEYCSAVQPTAADGPPLRSAPPNRASTGRRSDNGQPQAHQSEAASTSFAAATTPEMVFASETPRSCRPR